MHAPEPNGASNSHDSCSEDVFFGKDGSDEAMLDVLADYEVFEMPEEHLIDTSRRLKPFTS